MGELEAALELGSRQRENRVVLAESLAEPFVRDRHFAKVRGLDVAILAA